MIQFEDYDPSLFKTKMKLVGISETKLAHLCRLSQSIVNKIANGKSKKKSTILLIGLVLDMLATEEQLETFQLLEKQGKV